MNFDTLPSIVPYGSTHEISLMDSSILEVGKPKSMPPPVEDQPKRPLSAYNIFFQVERQRLITATPATGQYSRAEVYSICLDKATRMEKSKRPHRKMHGMIGFTELAKTIAHKWKELDKPEKQLFEERADDEKRKYAIELEEWLLRQRPTHQVKKRLSALRRGSLSKFISGRESVPSSFPPRPSPHTFSKPSLDSISHTPSPSNLQPVTMTCSIGDEKQGSDRQHALSRRQIQLQRARNLERLYQMQIQLYNEQVRLYAECNGDVDLNQESQQQIHHPQEALRIPSMSSASAQPRVVSCDSLHWGRSHGYEYSNPMTPDRQTNALYRHEDAVTSNYVPSPFGATEGRVSPFGDLFD